MKKRFLFPLIYLVLQLVTFPFEGIFLILTTPVNLLILAFEVASGSDQGTFTSKIYLPILGTIIQYFLIGYAWDKIAEYFQNKRYWDKPI
jgi:hypothetical protein